MGAWTFRSAGQRRDDSASRLPLWVALLVPLVGEWWRWALQTVRPWTEFSPFASSLEAKALEAAMRKEARA